MQKMIRVDACKVARINSEGPISQPVRGPDLVRDRRRNVWPQQRTDTPTGGGERLSGTAYSQCSLPHAWQSGNSNVLSAIKGETIVLTRRDENISTSSDAVCSQ